MSMLICDFHIHTTWSDGSVDPSVGLVSHLVRGIGAKTLGARLENQHLNTFILPSVSLLDRMFGMPCVVGKSMLMRRADLDAMGGVAAAKMAMDYGVQRMLGDRSSPGWVLLGPIRDVLAGALWFSASFSQNVEWRGRTLRITRGSRLVPVGEGRLMEPAAEAAR